MKLQHVKKLYFYVKKPFFFSILKQLNKDQSQLVFIFLESPYKSRVMACQVLQICLFAYVC